MNRTPSSPAGADLKKPRKKVEPPPAAPSLIERLTTLVNDHEEASDMIRVPFDDLRAAIRCLIIREPVSGVEESLLDAWDKLNREIDSVVTSQPFQLSASVNRMILTQHAFRDLIMKQAMRR